MLKVAPLREVRSENGAPKTVNHFIIQPAMADTAILQSLIGNGYGYGYGYGIAITS